MEGRTNNAQSAYLVQVGQLDHIRKHGEVPIGIRVGERQHLVGILLEVDGNLLSLLGSATSVTHHGLFVGVFRNRDIGLVALGIIKNGRSPSILLVQNVDVGLWEVKDEKQQWWCELAFVTFEKRVEM